MNKYIRTHHNGNPPFSTYIKKCNHYDFNKLNVALVVGLVIMGLILVLNTGLTESEIHHCLVTSTDKSICK